MKAAVLRAPYRIEMEEVPIPPIGPSEVLIRVTAVGICGSDLYVYQGKHPFRKPPAILGHEVAGVVEGLGEEVRGVDPGCRVTVEPQLGCDACDLCHRGLYNLCARKRGPGLGGWEGGFAEYFIAPARCVYRLPEAVDEEAGCLIEPLAVGVHAIRSAAIEPGASVGILGAGAIGLMCLLAAKRAGASRIFVTDLYARNLKVAESFGAELAVPGGHETSVSRIRDSCPAGLDRVLITAGFESVWHQALAIARRGAQICIVGMFHQPVQVDFLTLLMRELSIRTSWIYRRHDFETALDLAASSDVKAVITHRLSLADAAAALDLMSNRRAEYIKILLRP